MMALLRKHLSRYPATRDTYDYARSSYHNLRKLFYFWHDLTETRRFMKWGPSRRNEYSVLSAELLFQFHKLEKGFSMPNRRQIFGQTPAVATLDLLQRWRDNHFSTDDPVYMGAIECLRTYTELSVRTAETEGLLARLANALTNHPTAYKPLATPIKPPLVDAEAQAPFIRLMLARRSVRNFSKRPVDKQAVVAAVQIAQLSPSACNRQPWNIHVYSDKHKINSMLAFQNGNAGFGHTVPCLIVITCKSSGYFDASERWQPYVDGGLFSMSLLLALQSNGISTCCLNWCVEPETDKATHRAGRIPADEKIVMYIAAGYAASDALVPRSARRATDNVLHFH